MAVATVARAVVVKAAVASADKLLTKALKFERDGCLAVLLFFCTFAGQDNKRNKNMKFKVLFVMAAVAVLASCSSKKVTTLKCNFPSPESAPASVQILVGTQLDTMVAVVDGKLETKIPADKRLLSYVVSEKQPLQFVSDGSTITVDFTNKSVVSSDKNGVNKRLKDYLDWQDEFMREFQSKNAGLPEEEKEAYMEETLQEYNAHLKEVIKQNPDNVLALMCISSLELDDDEALLEILQSLSPEMKEIPSIGGTIKVLEGQLSSAEGRPFLDFSAVQDPEDPENSTVKLSDYVGKGKYILVDFWASWCGPCREEMPYIKEVYEKYHGDNFDIVGVAINDRPDDSKAAVEVLEIPWNQILNAQQVPADLYGIQYIPHVILFGPDGTILKRNLHKESIGEAVAEALGE